MKLISVKNILLASILAGSAAVCLLLGLRVQGIVDDDVYILSSKKEPYLFSDTEISNIESNGVDLTFVRYINPKVSNGFRTEEISVIATNENYAYFTKMDMKAGAFFNAIQVDRRMPVAVLNEAAAYQLFGNDHCVGLTVYLNHTSCKVIGVAKDLNYKDGSKIYIPYSTIQQLNTTSSGTGQLWCRFENLAEATWTMEKAGRAMEDIDILQMDLYKKVFMLRFFCLLILAGVFVIAHVPKVVTYKVKNHDRTGSRKWVFTIGWQIFGLAAGIALTLKAVRLSWCIPPYYELAGKNPLDVVYGIIDFYTLTDIEVNNMQFLSHWNVLSLLQMTICLISSLLLVVTGQRNRSFIRNWKASG